MATARQRQDYNNYSAKVSRTVQPKDPSARHFYISLVKSGVRMFAGGAFIIGGYLLEDWGLWIMAGSALLVIAEVLGIAEEL